MADVRDVNTDYSDRRSSGTDPGDRSAAEIEREVDAERARVAETLDALQEKVSVGSVVDQVVRAVGPYGADIGRNFGQQVRDNPLPLVLTGIGLAWLMMGSGPSARDLRSRYWEDDDGDYDRDYARDDDLDYGYRPTSASATPVYPEASWDTADEEASGPGMGERMRRAREGVGHAASGLADAAGRATGALSGAGSRASEAVRGAGGAMRGAGGSAWRSAGSLGRSARRGGRNVQDGFDRMLEEQPLVVGALAFAVGAAVGSAMPRTRTEDELFGQRSDRMMESVRGAAAEQGRKLQETAGAVANEATRVVEEKMSESSAVSGEGEPSTGTTSASGIRTEGGLIGERAEGEDYRPDPGKPRSAI